jgi:hypothetical protein
MVLHAMVYFYGIIDLAMLTFSASIGSHVRCTNRVTTDTGGEFIFAGGQPTNRPDFQAPTEHELCRFLNSAPVSTLTWFVRLGVYWTEHARHSFQPEDKP